jgi:hypothetical protein
MEGAENAPEPPPPADPPHAPPRKGGPGRVAAIVLISIGGLIGILIALGGIAIVVAHGFLRDDDGFYTTDTERLQSDGYAITSDGIDLSRESVGFNTEDLGATLRFSVEAADGRPIFVGIGRTSDVDRYLRGVAHSQVDDFHDRGPTYTQVPGRAQPRSDPGSEGFWATQSEGAGPQHADFDFDNGNWTAVAMNPDARRGVTVEGEAGVEIGWLIWVGIGLALVGAVIAGSCGYAVYRLAADRHEPVAPPPSAASV